MVKVRKSCSITQWLKNYDKKLWDAVEDACALGMFKPKTSGITFLYPTDSGLRKKIIDLLQDGEYEGIKYLQSLVIVDYLPTPRDWDDKMDDIPNRLGLKVEVKSANSSGVTLENGVVIKPFDIKEFEARSDRKNMSVWKYPGKTPPDKGTKTEYSYVKKDAKKPDKRGGFYHKGISKYGLAKVCEGKAQALIQAGRYNECNPYVNVLVSYLSYLDKTNSLTDEQLRCISYCPESTFYNIFEPYTEDAPSANIGNWLDATQGITLVKSPAASYNGYINRAANSSTAQTARKQTCEARLPLMNNRYPSILRSKLVEAYSKRDKKKAQRDEVMFVVLTRLDEILKTSGKPAAISFRDLCFEIEIMQRFGCKGRCIISEDVFNDRTDAVAFYSSAVLFALSDCFMYAPYIVGDETQQNELAKTAAGYSVNIVNVDDVNVQKLQSESVLVITQYGAQRRLATLAESQKEGVQSAIATALTLLRNGEISPSLQSALAEICQRSSSAAPIEQ